MAYLHDLADLALGEPAPGDVVARQRKKTATPAHDDGQRATLLRQASRKFRPDTMEQLAAVLDDVSGEAGRIELWPTRVLQVARQCRLPNSAGHAARNEQRRP